MMNDMKNLVVAKRLMARRAPRGKYLIKLEAVRNFDFTTPGAWEREIKVSPKFVTVRDFKEASKVATKFINHWELGGGNWAGGDVIDDTGTVVAYVSYNGRVWEGSWGHKPRKEIKIAMKELLSIAKEVMGSENIVARLSAPQYKALRKMEKAFNRKYKHVGPVGISIVALNDGSGLNCFMEESTGVTVLDGLGKIGEDPERWRGEDLKESDARKMGVRVFDSRKVAAGIIKRLEAFAPDFEYKIKKVEKAILTAGDVFLDEYDTAEFTVWAFFHIDVKAMDTLKDEKVPKQRLKKGNKVLVWSYNGGSPYKGPVVVKSVNYNAEWDAWDYVMTALNEYGEETGNRIDARDSEKGGGLRIEGKFKPKNHNYTPRNVKVEVYSDVVDEWVTFVVEMTGDWEVDTEEATRKRLLEVLWKNPDFKKGLSRLKGKMTSAPQSEDSTYVIEKSIPIPRSPDDFEDWNISDGSATFSLSDR